MVGSSFGSVLAEDADNHLELGPKRQWATIGTLSSNMFYNLYSKILVITALLKYIVYAEFLSLISNLKSTLASKALLSPRLSDESSVSAWSDFDAIFRRVTISFLSWSFHFRITGIR